LQGYRRDWTKLRKEELKNNLSSKVEHQSQELESAKKDLQHLGEIIQVKHTDDDQEVVSHTEMQNVLEELEKKCVDTAKTAVTEEYMMYNKSWKKQEKRLLMNLTEPHKAEV